MSRTASKTNRKTAVALTADDQVHVGMDVHKKSIHVAVLVNGMLHREWSTVADYPALADQLEPYRPALRQVAYEAGPTGFGLARLLASRQFPVMVCATAKMPKTAVSEAKTDRLDARKVAEYAAKGLLKAATIPTEPEERERALVRHRTHLVRRITGLKAKIKSTVLVHDCGTIRSWSQRERDRFLRTELPAELRFVLEGLFRELSFYEAEKKRLDEQLQAVLSREPHAAAYRHVQTHPGVGPVIAAYFLLELFRPERFRSGEAVARFLGLAPGVRQTGQTRRGGPLLKAGQGKLRSLLVEAAWRWRAVDPEARAIYGRVLANTGSTRKAIVALARRLAVRLWKMVVLGESYQPAVKAGLKAGGKAGGKAKEGLRKTA